MRIAVMLIMILMPFSSAAAQQVVPNASMTGTAGPSMDRTLRWDNLRYPAGMIPRMVTGADQSIAPRPALQFELDSDRSWSVTGAVVGAVAGAAVGVALGCLANRDSYGVYCGGQSDTKLVIGGLLGAGAGAWIGAVLPRRLR
ncbi:MAG TPA: hypothetical protein VK912_04895 [Longimicrobiales bacterium]|nr:hypothetical protein [Longimicrobiales bacterium]